MSIVELKRVSLCGLSRDKANILEDLQALGCLHLVPLSTPPLDLDTELTSGPSDAYKALQYLLDCPNKRRPLPHADDFDVDDVVERTLANQRRTRQVSDRRDFLVKRIKDLAPWGDIHLPDERDLAGLKLWFYTVPHPQMRQVSTAADLVWQVVHRDSRYAYVVVIAAAEPAPSALPVARTHTGRIPRSLLCRHLEQCEIELEDLAAEREALTRWIFLLSRQLARAEDCHEREQAAAKTLDAGEVFAIQGWAPSRELDRLRRFAADGKLALLIEEPSAADEPPTLLDNPPTLAGGETLTHFYQTPGYRGWDPSRVLFFSFAAFFAMILSDAGYAVVLGLLLLAFWRRLGRGDHSRRLRVLAATLVGASLVWGVLAGSYFGVAPAAGSLWAAPRIFDLNDFDAMMRWSVGIGVAHLCLANAVMARQCWRRRRAGGCAALGWIAAIVGGFIWWLGHIDGVGLAVTIGSSLLALGLLAVIWFSGGGGAPSKPSDALWRLLRGVKSLTRVSSLFGDVLSYLRLFALGLASASLALTFNRLADQLHRDPGTGLLLSLLVLLLGHALNLALSVVSGVVHGLRLNFIEFYNWAMSEEGYPFRAFRKREVEP